jgi:dimethylargininase
MTSPSTTRSSLKAITRALHASIAQCELTHLTREPIDYARAVAQHAAYEALLTSLGVLVTQLPAEPMLPDAVFVEDTAIVCDELAVITRPGAESRRPECTSIAAALRPWRSLAHIAAPGTLDGGDVLTLGRTVYVGLSSRSNQQGAAQLRELLAPFGYRLETVVVRGCLHLKSAVTAASDSLLLLNPAFVDPAGFAGVQIIETHPAEPSAANLLRLHNCVVMDAAYPRTAERLRARAVSVHTVDLSELAKAEGAVTCCSLIFG